MNNFLFISTLFIIINFIIIYFFEKNYNLINIYDNPIAEIKSHSKKMPIYGGILFYINFVIFFFLDISFLKLFFLEFDRFSISFFICLTFIFLVGIIDDKNNLNPLNKSICIILFSSILLLLNNNLIVSELKLDLIDKIYFYNFSFLFNLICIFLFVNAYNMLDGENLNIAGFNFFILLFLFYKTSFNLMFLIFIIANIFFSIQNYRNLTFFGNNGTHFFSFFLSIILIYCFKYFDSINEEDIILVLIFPVAELLRLFFMRIYKNKSPFVGDKNHFHHLSTKIFGKLRGIIFCQFFIALSLFLDFILQLYLWYIVTIFFVSYFVTIYLMNIIIKKQQ